MLTRLQFPFTRGSSLSGQLATVLLVALLVAFALMGAVFVRDRELRAGERLAMQAADRITLALEFIGTGKVSLPIEAAGLRVQLDTLAADNHLTEAPTAGDPAFSSLLQPKLIGAELIETRTVPGYAARARLPGGERVLATIVHTPPAHDAPPPPFAAFAGLAGTLAMALLWATLKITRTLRRIELAANQIDTRAHTAHLHVSGPNEVAAVLHAFNRMRERIEQQTADRVRVLEGVSHDLKTPLTRLRFRADNLTDPTLRESILRDIDAMQKMVAVGLDYMRTMEDAEPSGIVNLTALLQRICDDANNAGGRASLRDHDPLYITARPQALQRAFANLVDNALQYGGWAELAIEACPANIFVSIFDGGPGINEYDMARVFEPYYRGSAAGDASRGSGLGLAIARDSIIKHGGNIELHNLPGAGLEVRVRLDTNPIALNDGASDKTTAD